MSGERLNQTGTWNQKKGSEKDWAGGGEWPRTFIGPGELREEVISEQAVICLPCHLLTGA